MPGSGSGKRIVIIGDHGEGLGEHDEREHGHMLYNSTLRVPLIIAHPPQCKSSHRVTQAVSLVDLLPTLQECLGLQTTPNLSGRSLKAVLAGASVAPQQCYAETDVPFLEHHWAPQRCLVTENWKYIRSPRPEFYDLLNDPAELHNLAGTRPDTVQQMETMLGEALAKSGKLDEALQVYQKLAEDDPWQGAVHARLGWILGRLGNSEKALIELRKALELAPDAAEYRINLATTFLELNRQDEAAELLQSAREIDPACANFEIGKMLAASGDLERAVSCYKETLKSDPNWVPLYSEIAVLLARRKQFDEAIVYAARAVELSPYDADAHYNLGFMYLEQGKIDAAEEALVEALKRNPRHLKASAQLQRVRQALKARK